MKDMKTRQVLFLTALIAVFVFAFGCTTTPMNPNEPDIPGVVIMEKLETVQRCLLWGESGTINLQDIINAKRCAIDPRTVIGTDAKIDLVATRQVQQAGGKMAICVHPFYGPWDRGAEDSLRVLRANVKHYDYVAIDYEAPYIDLAFVREVQKLGKPVIVVPLARIDSMKRDYDEFSQMENVIYAWWNYSYQLKDWEAFFKDYKFKDSTKHMVLLSIGDKYNDYVSDKEIGNIIKNLPLRSGSFLPKNDYATFRKFAKELEKTK